MNPKCAVCDRLAHPAVYVLFWGGEPQCLVCHRWAMEILQRLLWSEERKS